MSDEEPTTKLPLLRTTSQLEDVKLLAHTFPFWKRWPLWVLWHTPRLKTWLSRHYVNPWGRVVAVLRVNSIKGAISHNTKK